MFPSISVIDSWRSSKTFFFFFFQPAEQIMNSWIRKYLKIKKRVDVDIKMQVQVYAVEKADITTMTLFSLQRCLLFLTEMLRGLFLKQPKGQ